MKNIKTLTPNEKQRQMVEWLELLLSYAKGEKEWDTGQIWVDEANILMPFEQGLWFENDTPGPGRPPFSPNP